MTRFAPDTVVRCPACRKLAIQQHLSSVSGWGLTSLYFKALRRGEVACPHCNTVLTGQVLQTIIKLDASWKKAIWSGIKRLNPIVTDSDEGNPYDDQNCTSWFWLKD